MVVIKINNIPTDVLSALKTRANRSWRKNGALSK